MNQSPIQMILARRSVRKYTAEPVGAADIEALLKAAMAAPSASDLKPWHFIVITDRETLDALAEAHPHGKMLFEAPLCISVCGVPDESRYWVQDCSAAAENLLLAAAALGLGAVWLGVYPREDRVANVNRLLRLPDSVLPLNLISIGHPAEKKEARTRYDGERVHYGGW